MLGKAFKDVVLMVVRTTGDALNYNLQLEGPGKMP